MDDLLGIWGDPATTGKPTGNDIRLRKKSMPIVAALAAGDDEAVELGALLFASASSVNGNSPATVRRGRADLGHVPPDLPQGGFSTLSAEEVARATWLVEACGGREWTAVRAKAHLDSALACLERARLSALPRRALADLAVYVVERES